MNGWLQNKIKYDGKELNGKYIDHNSKLINFHFEGKKQPLQYLCTIIGGNILFWKVIK